ncbi:MAG: TetR/AcrR family transcriptional regulator [Campylobacterota bacterium]|nr:TetR/AcrR family transcriptional regulator [Campylobacterota bacterium]
MHELKKELLLKEASTHFEEAGYEQMKVADLAKAAGVSIGTIYAIFDSKEGLYMAYIEHQIDIFFTELQKSITSDDDAEKRIRTYINLKFSYYTQKRKAIEQGAKNNPLFFNTLYSELSNPFQKIYLFLSECFRELNPELDQGQAIRMAFVLNGFSDGYVSQWLELQDDLMSRVDEACSLFICMIKGCK